MFRALSEAEINMQMITTSEIKISALVAREQAVDALRAVHAEFQLESNPTNGCAPQLPDRASPADAVDVVAQLQGENMEELMIDGIKLDESQGLVTLHGLKDRPGVAATVFGQVGDAGILVDMIVQSHLESGEGELSFTVPRDQVEHARQVCDKLAQADSFDSASTRAKVAKLSVSGIGLRSHTGVAIRMFDALSQAGINLTMINTSEVRVNVVVDTNQSAAAFSALETAFADVIR